MSISAIQVVLLFPCQQGKEIHDASPRELSPDTVSMNAEFTRCCQKQNDLDHRLGSPLVNASVRLAMEFNAKRNSYNSI
jgi:hypothetical protein